jgi:hypothetical protein
VLDALGGFGDPFGAGWREDMDLHFRLLKMQATIARSPQPTVAHPVPPQSSQVKRSYVKI